MKRFRISILTRDEISNKMENVNLQHLKTTENKAAGIYKNPENGKILISAESHLSFKGLAHILKSG